MKILQVIDTLDVGGAERMLVTLTNLLYRKGVSVSIMILVRSGNLRQELDEGIVVYELHRNKRYENGKMKQFASILSQFDIIHTHLKHNYRYTALSAKRFGITIPKLIFHDHSHTLMTTKWSLKYLKDSLFKSILKPKHYIGVSQANCDWAVSYLKLMPSQCYLLPNVIEKQTIVPQEDTLRKGLVMVGNISRIKHIEFAIRLTHQLNMPLTIYGRIKDVIYYKELMALIMELGLEEKITFIHDCNDIQRELHAYQYGIHTALKETGPLVLIEYLAQGLPFVSSASGQVYETLKKELPECFMDSYDMEAWIHQLTALHNLDKNRLEVLYNQYFSSNEYVKQCLSIYQNIQNS